LIIERGLLTVICLGGNYYVDFVRRWRRWSCIHLAYMDAI